LQEMALSGRRKKPDYYMKDAVLKRDKFCGLQDELIITYIISPGRNMVHSVDPFCSKAIMY